MYKSFSFILLMFIIFITGCTDAIKFKNEDVAAIVKGEEITIGDLRFLYPDDKILQMVEGTVKAKLVVQEAKKLNLDVSKEVEEAVHALGGYPSHDLDSSATNSIQKFAESQSKKFGMEPEEYYKKYIEKTNETAAFINKYVQEMLGDPDPEHGIEEYNELANQILDELVELHADDIQILIK